MKLTTAPSVVEPARDFPELLPHARPVVRLHPRRGTPGPRESHIGGPLCWPAAEPWPECADHEDVNGRPYTLRMVAVAQLTAVDFPEIRFPDDTDLVQLLWCPDWHDQPHPEGWGQACRLFWRRTAEVTDPLARQPDPAEEWDDDLDMVPRPCVLHPERVTDHPGDEELPLGLGERFAAWLEERGLTDDLTAIPGYKLGGFLRWGTTDRPDPMDCGDCGAPLELFLQFDSSEYGLGTFGPDGAPHRFRPLEERDTDPSDALGEALREPVGMVIGRFSHGGLFTCTADPRHPASFFTQ
ncbi:hypothetical protein SRB17_59810 [Streptomyces sp. RB17]|uniref:hypothetical protein n=1 Tax=Streptomyces sp. RB17 TaxID=2585197 RepID=UPI0012957921|nr:hypothetical protein [Streptomyces sp. RB17]MQY37973.1 hypothetical protein [Streptomyces sp. RB17]